MSDVRHVASTNAVRRAYGDGLEGLNRAADAVEQTLATAGWQVIAELLNVRKEDVERRLRAGTSPLEQADYALWHGRLDGIAAAPEVARALLEHRAKVMAEQQAKHEGTRAEPREPVRS